MFDIAIQIYKQKYGTNSSAFMAASDGTIWKIPIQQSNRPYTKVKKSLKAKVPVMFTYFPFMVDAQKKVARGQWWAATVSLRVAVPTMSKDRAA
jgi:hypothetical protein